MTSSTGNAIKLAFDTIRNYKLRAFLTVLGVIIGTGTIIGVGSILSGFDGAVGNVLKSFGTDTLIVFKFRVGMVVGRRTAEERMRKPLKFEYASAIMERSPSVVHVSPVLMIWNGVRKARYEGNDFYQGEVNGTDEEYFTSGQAEMMMGRPFTETENRHKAPVVTLGQDIYKALFASADPLGKWIDVDGHKFQVIGVMQRSAEASLGGQDGRIIIPYWTMRKAYPAAQELFFIVRALPGKLAVAADEVRGVLRQERRVPWDKPDSFFISTAEQMIEDFRKITAMTAIVMVVLSSIGLLVGGIGVMNIMLVSVTERTREIGIRKALGARRSDIVTQFLTEAVVLTFLGGLLGMLFGYGISELSKLAFPNLPTSVPIWTAVLGVVVSVGVGVFFGIWPANKAARLDPVVALRYE